MTQAQTGAPRAPAAGGVVLAAVVSASLVFLVEPMVARMVLPRLGGSAGVWNTSLAFFQAALLAGYAYAHGLQRIPSLRGQVAVHLAVLALAALALPLRITDLFGGASVDRPALWLLGVLAVSIGPPFAALSASAPLLQAWWARLRPGGGPGRDPYGLYAASNLGSLLALLAYPVLVEPLLPLKAQALTWSLGYGLFTLLIVTLALLAQVGPGRDAPAAKAADAPPVSWRMRLPWIALAATTSSLLLGVTAHITQDVGAAPFLWVLPLALYLLSFVIAFQTRPAIAPGVALYLQAALAPLAAALLCLLQTPWPLQLAANLGAVFFSALICHQALSARRPDPARLTDFYLSIALGGVIGGAFNAFAAPVVFNAVWEYPVVLGLACLARPPARGGMDYLAAGALVSALLTLAILLFARITSLNVIVMLLTVAGGAAFLLRRRRVIFAMLVLALGLASYDQLFKGQRQVYRSFFGELQIVSRPSPVFGAVRILIHGSTLHGVQALSPSQRCSPTSYYAFDTPMGQAMRTLQAEHARFSLGVVGLGAGTLATFTRPADRLRFFEIDPLVVRLALDPYKFSFVSDCARGGVAVTRGDARLSLTTVPDRSFDLLIIDAFSSDSIPAHLLTVEAMRTYLRVIKPDGAILLHLSNRNLALEQPASASVQAAGGVARIQDYVSLASSPYVESSEQAVIAAHDLKSLAPYLASGAWTEPARGARAWTDDYVNLFGALAARMMHPP